jgi:hypothetical protein
MKTTTEVNGRKPCVHTRMCILTHPSLSIVGVERHRALIALGRSLRVASARVVVAEEAERAAVVRVQLGRCEEALRRRSAEAARLLAISLLLRLRAAP